MKARLSAKEPHQSLDEQRLWADLLWSQAMCSNLFGDLAADLALADRAVHYAEACARYQSLLVDESTFSSVTVEELLDAAALPTQTNAVLRERYIPG